MFKKSLQSDQANDGALELSGNHLTNRGYRKDLINY